MNNFIWRSISFIKYLLRSKTAHGVHSPFVYHLITEVFDNETDYYAYGPIESYRAKLLTDSSTIEVQDFGAGSKVMKSNKRRIDQIAKNSAKSKKYAQLIFRLTQNLSEHNILELGTSLGITSLYLSYAKPNQKIVTIEGDPATAELARKAFRSFKRDNIISINEKFEDCLDKVISEHSPFSCVFIDGNHQKKAVLEYFEKVVNFISDDALIIIDDINWSSDMNEAWQILKKHKKVQLSIDLFEMGLIYTKTRNQHEHFVLRF